MSQDQGGVAGFGLSQRNKVRRPERGAAWRAGPWLLAAGLSPAVAQAVTEKAFLEELPVVLTASRIPQSLAITPGAMTVIDREFIRATGYRDIPSLLRLVPGFQVATERGGYSHVTYHGFGNAFPNRMQVLIDGRSVYSPHQLGGVDWFAVPLTIDEIERIEVFRGSNSATYGSNAYLGVVNIITRSAGDRPGTEAGFGAGNNRLGDLTFSHELSTGALGLRANVEIRHDHGLPVPVDLTRKSVATLRGDYRFGTRDELIFEVGADDSRRGLGYENTRFNGNGLRAERTVSAFAHLRWHRALGPGEDLQLGYYHNEDHARDEFLGLLPPIPPLSFVPISVPIDFNRKTRRDNVDFQHLFAPTAATRAVWGFELRRDAVRSQRVLYATGRTTQQLGRVFGNLEWQPLPALTLNAGAMIERVSGEPTHVAPRLFANWQLWPGHTLRLGQSIAYREQTAVERQMDFRFYSGGYTGLPLRISYVGYEDIRPERVTAREIGYLGQFRTWDSVLDVRIYREQISDFVQEIQVFPPPVPQTVAFCRVAPTYVPPVATLIPGTLSFCNSTVPARSRGFEWQLSARPLPGAQLKAAYSHQLTRTPFAIAHETEAPHHVVTATWLQEWSHRWSTTFSAIHYSAYEWGSGSLPVPAYTSFDGRIAYRFGEAAKPAELALQFMNRGPKHAEFIPSATLQAGNPMPRLIMLTGRFAM